MQVIYINGDVAELEAVNTQDSLVLLTRHDGYEVDMVAELQGGSNIFKELTLISAKNNLTICFLFYAKVYKKHYLSAIVIDNGKILGVSDMTHRLSPELLLDRGQSYRIYNSSHGKFGIVIGDDVFFPEVSRLLRLSKASYLVYLSALCADNSTRLCIKANSLCNGVCTVYACADECGAIGIYGNTLRNSTDFCSEFELNCDLDDKLLLARRSDIYNDVYTCE